MLAEARTLQHVKGYGSASRHGPLGGSALQIAPACQGVSAGVVKCRIDTAMTWEASGTAGQVTTSSGDVASGPYH